MTTPHSRRPQDVAAVREFLLTTLHRPDDLLPRYGEVAEVYGGIPRGVRPVLNSIARDCAARGEPDLSALVVLAGTGLPGTLHGRPVDPYDRGARHAWLAELARIRAHDWSNRMR